MLINYIRIALRNFRNNKFFTLVNTAGLAIGISASLVIYLIVQYEFSFEKNWNGGDRIYRVVTKMEFPDMTIYNSGAPVPTAQAMREEVPGLENATQFIIANTSRVTIPGRNGTDAVYRKQKKIIFADSAFFQVFGYSWLAGNRETALAEPFRVVLAESRASIYFPGLRPEEIIGRRLLYDDSVNAVVSGIVSDLHAISDFTFKEFVSLETVSHTGLKNQWNWGEWGSVSSSSQLFIKLKNGGNPLQVESQLAGLRNKYRSNKEQKDDARHYLQPLRDIHFNNTYDAFDQHQANKPTLYGLLALAAFLLLLGCINFINLSTALAGGRAKEIGIRKTMGSSNSRIIQQFLSETFLLTLFATGVSVAIMPWLLNIFRDYIPEGISFASIYNIQVIIFLFLLVCLVSFLSGFYPALVLTRFRPVTILKNQVYSGTGQTRKAWLRKILTTAQFVIAQFLLLATLVVGKQIRYSLNKELGYKKDAIVFFYVPNNYFSQKEDNRRFALLDKLNRIPEIAMISLAGSPPASGNTSSTTMKVNNGKKLVETMVEVKKADSAYFRLYHMKFVAGRNLRQSDTTLEYVINETYARFLGFSNPADAIGHFVERNFRVPIVGVLADFHTKSTHEAIKPLAYSSEQQSSFVFHLALQPKTKGNSETWKSGLEKTRLAFKEIYPEYDFNPEWFDESIARFYENEQHISRLLNWSAGLAIFISCLGLLGLVMHTTHVRTKEIGVRKVLGASVTQLVSLLSKDFLSLVLLAFIIAAPVAWWVLGRWLEGFNYRTGFSWWIFAISGGAMILISLLTIVFRTVRAVRENPVVCLRTE